MGILAEGKKGAAGRKGSRGSLLRPVGVPPNWRAVTWNVHIVGKARNKDSPAAERCCDSEPWFPPVIP